MIKNRMDFIKFLRVLVLTFSTSQLELTDTINVIFCFFIKYTFSLSILFDILGKRYIVKKINDIKEIQISN